MMKIERDWLEAFATLAVGSMGAALFWLVGFPAAVLTGPAAAVSLATILGMPMQIPPLLRDGVFLVIGLTIAAQSHPR